MQKFYVTMTWDDWPEGGSYGTVIEAQSHEHAEKLCRQEMAQSRAEGGDEHAGYYLENYADEWHTVDCFELGDFLERHGDGARQVLLRFYGSVATPFRRDKPDCTLPLELSGADVIDWVTWFLEDIEKWGRGAKVPLPLEAEEAPKQEPDFRQLLEYLATWVDDSFRDDEKPVILAEIKARLGKR